MNWTEAEYAAYLAKLTTKAVPPMAEETPEGTLLAQIRRYALDRGWLFHHVLDSRGCDPGFPDICCVKPGHPLIMAELKTAKGKLTIEQTRWMAFLRQATGIESSVWRPSDWPTIAQLLGA